MELIKDEKLKTENIIQLLYITPALKRKIDIDTGDHDACKSVDHLILMWQVIAIVLALMIVFFGILVCLVLSKKTKFARALVIKFVDVYNHGEPSIASKHLEFKHKKGIPAIQTGLSQQDSVVSEINHFDGEGTDFVIIDAYDRHNTMKDHSQQEVLNS